MKRPLISLLAVCLLLLLALPSCRKDEKASADGEVHETIAPATPQPAPTGTDAMTQTMEVEGGSAAEGGGTTGSTNTVSTNTTGTATTTTTSTTTAPATSTY